MNNLFKVLLLSSPALALLFFYTIQKQGEITNKIQLENARFESDWVMMEKCGFGKVEQDEECKSYWSEKLQKAREEEQNATARLMEKQQKIENFEKEFQKAIEEGGKK